MAGLPRLTHCVLVTAGCLSAISPTVWRLVISALVLLERRHAPPQNKVGLENSNVQVAIHLETLDSEAITSIVRLLTGFIISVSSSAGASFCFHLHQHGRLRPLQETSGSKIAAEVGQEGREHAFLVDH